MSPRKIACADTRAWPTSSRLLRHLEVIRTPLFTFLTPPDFIALLWTDRSLQDDDEILHQAFDASTRYARCFFRGCTTDWCAPVPMHYYEEWHQCDQDQEPRAIMEAWEARLGSTNECASLLSLAWLMTRELGPLLYKSETPVVTSYSFMPFILPLARLDEIKTRYPVTGPATALGCHFENMSGEGPGVVCALCDASLGVNRDAEEFQEQREAEQQRLQQRIDAANDDDEIVELEAQLEALQESMNKMEEMYDLDNISENLGNVLLDLARDGKVPPLKLIGAASEDELSEALDVNFYGATLFRSTNSFCKHYLQPLATFFHRNGFGPVYRATLKQSEFESAGGKYDKEEIRSVEMVGAAAPHGFFAGFYYVARYT